MSFKFDNKGLKKFQKDLKTMATKAQQLDGQHQLPFDELFNEIFMRKYTTYIDFNTFINSKFDNIQTKDDFTNVPDNEMDMHVKSTTSFNTWEEMLKKATEIWVTKQSGF